MVDMESQGTFQDCSPLNLLEQCDSSEVNGYLQIVSGQVYWWIYFDRGKIVYASHSIEPLERLERHLRRLGHKMTDILKKTYKSVQLSFSKQSEQLSRNIDYSIVCSLLTKKQLNHTQTTELNEAIFKEVIESLLWVRTGSYEFSSERIEVPLVGRFSVRAITATIFAKDWRVTTNVPYSDNQTRAIGTRASREVANKVLNQREIFLGDANIVGTNYLTAYGPLYDHQKQLNPSAAKPIGMIYVGEPETGVQESQRNLEFIGYELGGMILLLAGVVAVPIARSFSQPLRRLNDFAKAVATGEPGVRLKTTERQDEIGVLSQELNQMASSIEANLEAVRRQEERSRLLANITSRIRESLKLEDILNTAVNETRVGFKSDRVIVYRFDSALLQSLIKSRQPSSIDGYPQSQLEPVEHPPVDVVPQSQKNTILVVDDSINVRRFLALTLEKAGYQVEEAKDGQDAIDKIMGGLKVQAVICDIEMPRLDGYGFLSRVKSNPAFSQLPVAMLTSRSGEKHRRLAMNLGAAAYLSKPYAEPELLETLKRLLQIRTYA